MFARPLLLSLSGILAIASCGASGTAADAGNGDGGGPCIDNSTQCDGNSFMSCVSGVWQVTEQCTSTICDPTYGCVACTPNQNFCEGDSIRACTEDGKIGGFIETCEGDFQCSDGSCRNLCLDAETALSYLGCEYWAVDLENALQVQGEPNVILGCTIFELLSPGVQLLEDVKVCANGDGLAGQCDGDDGCPVTYSCVTKDVCGFDADGSPFAVVVSNPHDFAVDVTISNGAGTTSTVSVLANEVASLYPTDMGFAEQNTGTTSIAASAYKVTTTAPVAAYQFNPLDNENVFSNDGSLLIPRHTFDTDYYALTWQSLDGRSTDSQTNDLSSYVAVVAWQDATEVTVTPSADVVAGLVTPAIAAGTPTVFTMNAFDVLNLEAGGVGDLTGTRVQVTGGTDATVGVFAGHEAVAILSPGATCCADHIEEMMFPTSTWGSEFAVAHSKVRVDESDILRIMAQSANTTVTISSGALCPVLASGEFCEIEISTDVEISSTEPILIGHYLKSVGGAGGGTGDPSLAIAVPVEQYRSTYSFLVPSEYDEQYISVVATMGVNVTLDGTDIGSQLTAMGSNGRGAGRILVEPGQHELLCTGGCGLEVYGYSADVSYFFAGGLDLEQIVID